MKTVWENPKTTMGGVLCLCVIAMMWTKVITPEVAVTLLAVAGAWIGGTAKDSQK